jgi:hypothetical protein
MPTLFLQSPPSSKTSYFRCAAAAVTSEFEKNELQITPYLSWIQNITGIET